jgi:aldehyde dehydrogenase (NAD+)
MSSTIPVERTAEDRLWIGGEWVDGGGDAIETQNPATGDVIASVAAGSAQDIDRAVAAARSAFDDVKWRRMDAADRGALLWRMADILERRGGDFAKLESLDNGKPIREAQIDIRSAVDALRYYAGWTTKLQGDTLPVRGNYLNYTLREPLGVVGGIIPWNFPLLMAVWKIAPALACGNTLVLKPAEQTPLSALELANVAAEAGLPAGVLNIVPGYGSTAVGRHIMREAAGTLKKVSLELGGKSPNIVFADADLEAAARGAFSGIFYNNGQCCTAGSRLLVHESARDALVDQLVARAGKMQPGDPLDPKTRLGPVISQEQMERVLGYVEKGRADGAELLVGGNRAQYNGEERGYWVQPTVFAGVQEDHCIAQEEIFGPVLSVITFSDEDEALAMANRSEYGLAAGVWTTDIKKAHRVARELQAGTVWINTYHPGDAASPFGGYKQSGFGRELGEYSLDLYTQIKSVWVDLS